METQVHIRDVTGQRLYRGFLPEWQDTPSGGWQMVGDTYAPL